MATLKNTTINDTGFVQLPVGTTGQRPGTPATGMIRYNTDYGRNEIYDGAKWVLTNGSNSAGGGTVTSVGGYNIHTFTTVGATTFTMNYPGTVEILLVGGGGGGAGIGGGGGAGGYFYESQVQLNAGAYTINVGSGGGGEPSHNSLAAPGSPTSIVSPSFTRMQAVGGGRGLPYARGESPSPHGDGGSGGGGPGGHGPGGSQGHNNGCSSQTSYGAGQGSSPYNFWHQGPLLGTQTGNNYDHISLGDFSNGGGHGVMGQGHPGGSGAHGGGFSWAQGPTTVHSGGGGGGAGSSGKPVANGSANGNGGVGLASQISGTVTYYAGGGGSGTHVPGNVGGYGTSGAQGGQGGGGVGGSPGVNGGTGGTNTGGGGGGGLHNSPDVSGPGGPGIAIIRYRNT